MSPLQTLNEASRSVPLSYAIILTLGSIAWSWASALLAQFPGLSQAELIALISTIIGAGSTAVGGFILLRKAWDNYKIEKARKLHEAELILKRERQAVEIEIRRQQEEAYKDSFAEQIEELKETARRTEESLAASRKGHHDFRDEAAARDARNQLEIERLRQEVAARDKRHAEEVRRWMDRDDRLTKQIDTLERMLLEAQSGQKSIQVTTNRVDQTTQRIDEKTNQLSGDNLPIYRPTPKPTEGS